MCKIAALALAILAFTVDSNQWAVAQTVSGPPASATTTHPQAARAPRAQAAQAPSGHTITPQVATQRIAPRSVAKPVSRPSASEGTALVPVTSRPVEGRSAAARGRDAMRYAAHAHPGLGDSDFASSSAEAFGMCGQMRMPAAALREISRGFRRGHTGIDLMAPHGSPAHAAAAGSVLYAGWYYAYGNIVDIRHAHGVVTRYAHLFAIAPDIIPGVTVLAGDEIGKVGATGRASGPHIHFEVRLGGRPVDPGPYLALTSCPTPGSRPEILEAYDGARSTRATQRPRQPAQ